ncbi:MAG: tyrosine-type recombinase/integrase [Sphaerochaeta sp.]
METPYRFAHRKGRKIQVLFRHIPGKWLSTGTNRMVEAIKFAEAELVSTKITTGKIPTIREFSRGLFTEDRYGHKRRNERRNLIFKDIYYKAHQGRMDNYIIPMFGDYLINSLTDIMIEDWFLGIESIRSGNELSDNTKNKVLACFRIVFDEAKRLRLVKDNPADQVSMINEIGGKRRAFSLPELGKMYPINEKDLLKIWGTRSWATYFLVMRDTGFRPGEVAALTKDCYIPQFRGIYTESSVDYATRKIQKSIKTTKKGQPYKVGILSQQTMAQLGKLMLEMEGEYLFISEKGKLICPEVSNKHLRASCVRAGVDIEERTQYCLRHSFETNMSGKISSKDMLELMAHTSYRGEYDHRSPQQILEQLQPVGDVLDSLA